MCPVARAGCVRVSRTLVGEGGREKGRKKGGRGGGKVRPGRRCEDAERMNERREGRKEGWKDGREGKGKKGAESAKNHLATLTTPPPRSSLIDSTRSPPPRLPITAEVYGGRGEKKENRVLKRAVTRGRVVYRGY